jgi:hypothetical protein
MKSRMPDDYRIPDDPDAGQMDAAYLRTCLGLRVKPGEIPPALSDAVRRAHYDMARSLSILGATGPAGMTPTQLATVVALALRDPDMEQMPSEQSPEANFMDEVDARRVIPGQKVAVKWQMQDQPAHFIEKDGDRLKLLVKGSERRFRPDLVRYVEEGEFPDVPDNLNSQPAGI